MSVTSQETHSVLIRARARAILHTHHLDTKLSRFGVLIDLEQLLQVPKTSIVVGTVFLTVFLHAFDASGAPISNLIGWAIPAHLSSKAVETPPQHDAPLWLKYWVVFGFVLFVESFALCGILHYLPWYFVFKSLFFIWLQYRTMDPLSSGSNPPLMQLRGLESEAEGGTLDNQSTAVTESLPTAVPVEESPDPEQKESKAESLVYDRPIKEEGCFMYTYEKKYYEFEEVFVKRSFAKGELGPGVIERYMVLQRMKNEVAAIRYIQKNTNIPTPHIRCAFEDHGRFYIITDIVSGVTLADLPDDKKAGPIKEVEGFMAQLHAIKSNVMGGFAGDNILPYRLTYEALLEQNLDKYSHLKFREAASPEFVLCHNDLSQHNVIVDEETLQVKAILDWEYAGFYPPEFDRKYYLRPGPSAALDGEEDDVAKLLGLVEFWQTSSDTSD